MATLSVIPTDRLTQLRDAVRAADEATQKLRERDRALRADLDQLTEREQRAFRLFAEADKDENVKLEKQLAGMLESRTKAERELKAIALAIEEHDDERRQLLAELQPLEAEFNRAERRRQIAELNQALQRAQEYERECDRRLLDAREASNRAFFAWRAAVDQETLDEQAAALEVRKAEWQRHSGPNAPSPWKPTGGQ